MLGALPRSPPAKLLRTLEEYEKAREEFSAKYACYRELDRLLNKNREDFEKLAAKLKEVEGTAGEAAIRRQIDQEFKKRGGAEEVERISRRYRELHEELKSMKLQISEFVHRIEQQMTKTPDSPVRVST